MYTINYLCAYVLCCTIVGTQCDLKILHKNKLSDIQSGFAFEMIMTKLNLLEDELRKGRLNDLSEMMETLVQQLNNTNNVRDSVYSSCREVPSSGVYTIQPEKPFKEPMSVLCDQDFEKGGWIVIQHRFDGSTNFYRNWQEYKNGFGNLEGEFWLGLDRIHQLTSSVAHELAILLEDFDGKTTFAKYDQFEVGDENQKYAILALGDFYGTAGDSFSLNSGMKFSTFDADNDKWENHCAVKFAGAWWHKNCHSCNLNGKYLRGETAEYATGMVWYTFRGHNYALKTSKMMIRPKHH